MRGLNTCRVVESAIATFFDGLTKGEVAAIFTAGLQMQRYCITIEYNNPRGQFPAGRPLRVALFWGREHTHAIHRNRGSRCFANGAGESGDPTDPPAPDHSWNY